MLRANAGITATTIVCSNITTAAITAASLHSTGAITAASGLTVTHANGITSTKIHATALITANGGLDVGGNGLTVNNGGLTIAGGGGGLIINSGGGGINVAASSGITTTKIYAGSLITANSGLDVSGGLTVYSSSRFDGFTKLQNELFLSGITVGNRQITSSYYNVSDTTTNTTQPAYCGRIYGVAPSMIFDGIGNNTGSFLFRTYTNDSSITSVSKSSLLIDSNNVTINSSTGKDDALIISDQISRSIRFIPSSINITPNPICKANDSVIYAHNNNPIVLTSNSLAFSGIRITNTTVLIGASNVQNDINPAGSVECSISGVTIVGTITCNSTINANSFNSTSDYRIKQFVKPITASTVDSLNPVSYYNILSNKTDLGFIAHEVQPHFPMLVNGEKDGKDYQSINYTGLIPVLVAEIKDLKSQVKMLTSKVEQLMQSI
jgi:hypothetical protein